MKLAIVDKNNAEIRKIELPVQFNESFRPDLIERAVLAIQSHKRQPYGAKPRAGLRQQAKISRRRRDYKTSYGHGISRVPRKIMSHRGTRFVWVAAVAPGTVGGRRAHPPKAEKIWAEKINKKENRKAIRSAISATVNKGLVSKRGHKVPANYPFIVSNDIQDIAKTNDLQKALLLLGLKDELERSSIKKVRAGRGKMRGRKYQTKKGPLLIVADDCKVLNASNIPGLDIVKVKDINAELLAPGASPGRICLWTEAAIDKLTKDKLFM